jgi:hypothetical protein
MNEQGVAEKARREPGCSRIDNEGVLRMTAGYAPWSQTRCQKTPEWTGAQIESVREEPVMALSPKRLASGLVTVALAAVAVLSPILGADQVDAAKHQHHGHHDKPPVSQDNVSIKSIKTGPDGGGTTSRDVLVVVHNDGDTTVGPFVIDLTADRQGAARPAQASTAISLAPNQSQTVSFTAIGCKWLNAANGATLTATTNPNPVQGEDGSRKDNTLTVAPGLDFSGHPECSGV